MSERVIGYVRNKPVLLDLAKLIVKGGSSSEWSTLNNVTIPKIEEAGLSIKTVGTCIQVALYCEISVAVVSIDCMLNMGSDLEKQTFGEFGCLGFGGGCWIHSVLMASEKIIIHFFRILFFYSSLHLPTFHFCPSMGHFSGTAPIRRPGQIHAD